MKIKNSSCLRKRGGGVGWGSDPASIPVSFRLNGVAGEYFNNRSEGGCGEEE